MNYEEAKKLMLELKTPHLKVIDTNSKKIVDFIGELSVENTINKLELFAPTLQTYGRVTFLAATENCLKQNWKDCYQWPVTFSNTSTHLTTHQATDTPVNKGYVSANEANLMATVQTLQMQMQFQQQINELKEKIAGKDSNKEEKWEKYLPLAAMIPGFEITDEKIAKMMQLYQIQGMSKGFNGQQNSGINGLHIEQKKTTEIEQSPQEKELVAKIVAEMDKLSEKTSDEKILALIKGLNNNPAYIDMAINFMNTQK